MVGSSFFKDIRNLGEFKDTAQFFEDRNLGEFKDTAQFFKDTKEQICL